MTVASSACGFQSRQIDIRPIADSNIGQLSHHRAGLKQVRASRTAAAGANSRIQPLAAPKATHMQ